MKKIIKNTSLLVCAGVIAVLILLVLTNSAPIEINIPHITADELAAKKKEAAQAAKAEHRKQRLSKMYTCQTDEDCLIVDKDPCGCGVGPKGVTAINVGYITDFNEINNKTFGMISCPEKNSREKECSLSAHAVCQAKRCKIVY